MTDIVLKPVSSGYNISIYNDNNDTLQNVINNQIVHAVGGNNIMDQDLDMNNNSLLNVATDLNDPNSLARIQDLGGYKAAAAQSAIDAANSATSAANSAASAGSNLGYETKAQMDADLSPPDGTIRIVTNDPIIENNQTYRKSGASGTGSWVQAVDRVANLSNDLASLSNDLASTEAGKGAELIGYISDGTGAVARTALDKLLDAEPTPQDFGAVGDGVADDTAALQAAIDAVHAAGGGCVRIPKGTYKFTGTNRLVLRSGVSLRAAGAVIFDFTDRDNTVDRYFYLVGGFGEIGPAVALTSDMASDAWVASFDTSSFSEGDLVKITSDETYPESESTDIYKGEFFIIDEILSGTQARFNNSSHDSYAAASNARLHKVTPICDIVIEGIKFVGQGRLDPDYGDFGLGFTYGRNITVRDCTFDKIDSTELEFRSCYDFYVENCKFSHTKYTSEGVASGTNRPAAKVVRGPIQYQVRVSDGSQYGVIRNCKGENARHFFNTGTSFRKLDGSGDSAVGFLFGLNRHILVDGCFAKNTWHACYSTHNDGDFITFTNCVAENSGMAGFNPRAKNIKIVNCDVRSCATGVLLSGGIYSCVVDGCRFTNVTGVVSCDQSTTISAKGVLTVTNCEANIYNSGIYFYSVNPESELTGTINILGNRLLEGNVSGNATPIRVRGAFGTVNIKGNLSDTTNAGFHIRVEGSPVDVLIAENSTRNGLRPVTVIDGTRAVVVNNTQSNNTVSSVYANNATTAITQNNV